MATFNSLPVEMILMLTQHLENDGLRQLRLVSKEVSITVFDCFARRHFRKKGFFITTESLSVLDKISSHVDFAPYIEHLWFNPDCYTFVKESQVLENNEPSKVGDIQQEAQLQSFRFCTTDHVSLLVGSQLSIWLSTCFSRLKNLRVMGMRRGKKHRPWGYSLLRKKIGLDPRVLGRDTELYGAISETTILFAALLTALDSTTVMLKRLYTDAIQVDDLRSDRLNLEGGITALRNVECLEANFTRSTAGVELMYPPGPGNQILPFLSCMPAITDISLTICPNSTQDYILSAGEIAPNYWTRMYTHRMMEIMSEQSQLCNLQRVKLEKLVTSGAHLQAWLEASFDKLESLKLKDIDLKAYRSWDTSTWTTVFTFLCRCEKLRYLFLSHLIQRRAQLRFCDDQSTAHSSRADSVYEATWIDHDYHTIVVSGLEETQRATKLLINNHWYTRGMIKSAEIDDMWYTDTSDEAAFTEDEE